MKNVKRLPANEPLPIQNRSFAGWLRAHLGGGAMRLPTHPPESQHPLIPAHSPLTAIAQSPLMGAPGEGFTHAGYARLYQQSPWVYVAVSRIAEAAALVPLHISAAQNDERSSSRRVAVAQHPLERLLEAPNPYISRFELLEQTVGFLELTGNAYWYLVGGADGLPAEIYPLMPDRVRIVPDARQYVKGYLYEMEGQRIPLLPQEVVHFRRWHPSSDFYGLSALEAARLAIITDRAMGEWNRNTFSEGQGVPAGIVAIKDFVTDADFERIQREWRQSYGGGQRKTAFLRGGAVEWHHIGLSHVDLDFLRGRTAHRDEILQIFGIPTGLISENATEANARVAERQFVERTLYPKLVRIAGKITNDLLPFWADRYGDCRAEFEDIRPTDVQARLDEIRVSYPIMSINEIRGRYYDLPPVVWGNGAVGEKNRISDQGLGINKD